jgi:adenylate cyclase
MLINYLNENRPIEYKSGDTILGTSLKNGIHHSHTCGGNARCSSCRVVVRKGLKNCTPRTPGEKNVARTLGFKSDVRLACQTKITGNISISKPPFDELDVKVASLAIAEGTKFRRGEVKELTIMFVDIKDFTPLVERMPSYDIVAFLNRFFYLMGGITEKNGARIIDYFGDGFLSVFGIKKDHNKEQQCLEAGIEMLNTIEKNRDRAMEFSYPKLEIRIGVRTGKAIIGTVGTAALRKFAVMGDAVNTASRIEGANKKLDTHFLICDDTYGKVKKDFKMGSSHLVKLKGKKGKFKIWDVSWRRK